MSFFNERYDENASVDPTEIASGPKLGFLDAFKASYEAQTRANSQYGLESYFESADAEQAYKMRKQGLASSTLYEDAEANTKLPLGMPRYKAIAEAIVDGKDPQALSILKRRDAELQALQKQHPDMGIQTYSEMFADIRKKAEEAEHRAASDASLGGWVGWFAGGMAGAMNPSTDPLNAFTLGLGGVGRGILARAGSEGAVQGGIELTNQLTGVADNRRLLGLPEADIATNVALAAGGGALLQGVGTAAHGWFKGTPKDPAPAPPVRVAEPDAAPVRPETAAAPETPPAANVGESAAIPPPAKIDLFANPERFDELVQQASPIGTSRLAKARTIFDVDHTTRTLEAWDGPRPWEAAPATETKIVRDGISLPAPDTVKARQPGETVDDIARRLDPETFNVYDKLVARKQTFQRWISELKDPRAKKAAERVAEIDAEILRLKMRIPESTKRLAKKYEARIAELQPERDAEYNAIVSRDTPDMARVRRDIQKVDEQMRDMAPVVSRAYARAEGKYRAYDQQRADIAKMMAEGKSKITPNTLMVDDATAPPPIDVPKTLEQKAPIVASRPDATDPLPANADAADKANAVIAANMKDVDEAVKAYQASVGKMLKMADEVDPETGAKVNSIDVLGSKLDLNEVVVVPLREGNGTREVTIRQLLAETEEDNGMMQAVTTCSVR